MTEPTYLTAVRESYDTVADAYVERVPRPTALDPLSRALLAMFAETVRDAGLGPVADIGCGPGFVTAHLAALGVPAFGIDLSPRMLELTRRSHPELTFREGSMTALDIEAGSLGGILAYFSTHHTPPDHLPLVHAEFARTLAPGAHLLLSGHVGPEARLRPTHAYGGHPVSYETHLLPLERLVELLEEAGLEVTARVAQEAPEAGGGRAFGTVLARRRPATRAHARTPADSALRGNPGSLPS
ncbi:class I SAM-dependent methyltransferase [Streptomyces sp. NPDC005648]|uniref:class I SAM-dependent methyltransferase n=1 Tax=Streptomyces sp. NPDC005648 TaxID=3157044 RepID=UPI0033BA680C